MIDPTEPYVDPETLRQANQRHDADMKALGIPNYASIKSAWNPVSMMVGKELSDKKIAKYEKAGFYSADFKEARKALMDKKRLRMNLKSAGERKGNFLERDGRLIYCP